MKEPEKILPDYFLKELLTENTTPGPAANFTAKVMQAVEAEAVQQAVLAEPLISRRVWQRLGMAMGLLLLLPFIFGIFIRQGWTEWMQAVTAFTLPEKIQTLKPAYSPLISYLTQFALIAASCLILFILDKLYRRYTAK